MESGSGSVHANVGSAAKFSLNAETGSGSIHVEQPFLSQRRATNSTSLGR